MRTLRAFNLATLLLLEMKSLIDRMNTITNDVKAGELQYCKATKQLGAIQFRMSILIGRIESLKKAYLHKNDKHEDLTEKAKRLFNSMITILNYFYA